MAEDAPTKREKKAQKKAFTATMTDTISNIEKSVSSAPIEASAQSAAKTLNDALATSAGQIAGEIKGGIQNLTQKFDAFKGELNTLTMEGLVDKGAASLENMAVDFVSNKINGFFSSFGANVTVTYSEPDSNGIVVPIA